jgi:hypothetical protein
MCTIDNLHYDNLTEIDNIFKNYSYKSNISSKSDPNTIDQTLIYYNPINRTESYTIQIQEQNQTQSQTQYQTQSQIYIQIPIKNSNYYYRTTHKSLEETIEYIKVIFSYYNKS